MANVAHFQPETPKILEDRATLRSCPEQPVDFAATQTVFIEGDIIETRY